MERNISNSAACGLPVGGGITGTVAHLNFGTPQPGGGCNAGPGICNVSVTQNTAGLSVEVIIAVLSITEVPGSVTQYYSTISMNFSNIGNMSGSPYNSMLAQAGNNQYTTAASFANNISVNVGALMPYATFFLNANADQDEIANLLWGNVESAVWQPGGSGLGLQALGMPNMVGSQVDDYVVVFSNVLVTMNNMSQPNPAPATPAMLTFGAANNGIYFESNPRNSRSSGGVLSLTEFNPQIPGEMTFPVNIVVLSSSPVSNNECSVLMAIDFNQVALNSMQAASNTPFNYWGNLFNFPLNGQATSIFTGLNSGAALHIGAIPQINGVTYPPAGQTDSLMNWLFNNISSTMPMAAALQINTGAASPNGEISGTIMPSGTTFVPVDAVLVISVVLIYPSGMAHNSLDSKN